MLVEDKSYYSREWEEGEMWSFGRSIEEESPSWGSIDIEQVKPWKVVEVNIK